MGSIFQAANHEQENIFPWCLHLNFVDIGTSTDEEATHVLENIDEDKSEHLYQLVHTVLKVC